MGRLFSVSLADAFGQLFDLRFRKLGAWVVRIFDQPVKRHEQGTPSARTFTFARMPQSARRCRLSCRRLPRTATNFARLLRISVEEFELIGLGLSPRQQSHRAIVPLSCLSRKSPRAMRLPRLEVPRRSTGCRALPRGAWARYTSFQLRSKPRASALAPRCEQRSSASNVRDVRTVSVQAPYPCVAERPGADGWVCRFDCLKQTFNAPCLSTTPRNA